MSWCAFRTSRLGLVSATFVGFAIGWNVDIICAVEGPSMIPTLQPKEYILFLPYSLLSPLRVLLPRFIPPSLVNEDDIVVVKISQDLSVCKRVKRITANPAEAVPWDSSFATLEEHIHYFRSMEGQEPKDFGSLPLRPVRSFAWDDARHRVPHPRGWMWLEGDNQSESMDSRHCGAVPLDCLRGRVIATLYPRLRLLTRKIPQTSHHTTP